MTEAGMDFKVRMPADAPTIFYRGDPYLVVSDEWAAEVVADLPDDVLRRFPAEPPEDPECGVCGTAREVLDERPSAPVALGLLILVDYHDGPRRERKDVWPPDERGKLAYERCCRLYALAAAELDLRAWYGPLLYAEPS